MKLMLLLSLLAFIQCGRHDEQFLCNELDASTCDELSSDAITGLKNLQSALCVEESQAVINDITAVTSSSFRDSSKMQRGQVVNRTHSNAGTAKIYILKVFSDAVYILVKKLDGIGETADIVYKYTDTNNTNHITTFQTTACADEDDELATTYTNFYWDDVSINGVTSDTTGQETTSLKTKLSTSFPALFGKFNIEYNRTTKFDDKNDETSSYTITVENSGTIMSGTELVDELTDDFNNANHCDFDANEAFGSPSCSTGKFAIGDILYD